MKEKLVLIIRFEWDIRNLKPIISHIVSSTYKLGIISFTVYLVFSMTLPFSSLLPCMLLAAASVSLRLLWADLSDMSEHNFSEFSWCNLDGVFCLTVSLRFEHPANVFCSNLLRFSDNNWSFEDSSTNFLL